MTLWNLRHVAMATAFAGTLLTMPTESQAIFHWCKGCNAAPAAPPAPAYVAPPAVSYYAPCAPPTVVNYVPQTYYRPVVVNTPVTSYQPVTSCGLCGPTTSMRPVTTMVQQTQYVPYTSYRLMYSAAYPAYTANYMAPAVVAPAAIAPAPAPACCGAGAPAVVPSAPATMGAPSLSGPVPGTSAYPPAIPYIGPSNTATYAPAAPQGSVNYGPSISNSIPSNSVPSNGAGSTGSGSTTNNYAPNTPAPAPSNSGGNAPAYDPLHPTAPPDIKLSPIPEEPTLPKAGPTSAPRQSDVDARTALRGGTISVSRSGVIPAQYTQPTAPMPNVDWRPSAR